MGKHALINAFCDEVRLGRGRALRARARSGGGEQYAPFLPVFQAIASRLARRPPTGLDTIPHLGALGRLSPDFAALDVVDAAGIPAASGLADEQARTAFRGLLGLLTEESPFALILENTQWAEPASVQLLEELWQDGLGATGERFLVVASLRTDEVAANPPLDRLLKRLEHREARERLTLRPLDASEVGAFLAGTFGLEEPPRALARFLRSKTGGSPQYLKEVAHSLVEAELVHYVAGRWQVDEHRLLRRLRSPSMQRVLVADSYRGLVMRRIERLEDGTRRALEVLCLFDGALHFEVLRDALDMDEDPALDAVDRLLSLGMASDRDPDPEAVGVPERRFRQAVIELIPSLRVRRLHHRIAQALERHQAAGAVVPPGTLARHYHGGGMRDQAIGAYRQAISGALGQANLNASVRLLDRLIELAEEPDERSLEIVDEALLIDAIGRRAKVLRRLGDYERLGRDTRRLLGLLRRGDDKPALARALALDSSAQLLAGQGLKAREQAEEALSLALELEDEVVELEALNALGASERILGRLDASLELRSRAVELAARSDQPDASVKLCINMGTARKDIGQLDEALAAYAEAAEVLEERNDPFTLALAQANAVDALLLKGDHPEALSRLRPLVEFAQEKVGRGLQADLLALLARVLLAVDRAERAADVARRAQVLAEVGGSLSTQALISALLAQARSRLGEPEAAKAHARKALETLERLPGGSSPHRLEILHRAGRVLAGLEPGSTGEEQDPLLAAGQQLSAELATLSSAHRDSFLGRRDRAALLQDLRDLGLWTEESAQISV